jgi:indolepyruvate ferredoxin oxidoreductase
MKGLRGTLFDPFGYSAERRMERRLISDYRNLIDGLVDRLDTRNISTAIKLAQAASDIGGYGPIKTASVTRYESLLPGLLRAVEMPASQYRVPDLLNVHEQN